MKRTETPLKVDSELQAHKTSESFSTASSVSKASKLAELQVKSYSHTCSVFSVLHVTLTPACTIYMNIKSDRKQILDYKQLLVNKSDFWMPFTPNCNSCIFFQLEEEERVGNKVEKKEPPRFQLSSLNPQERIDYSHLIEELGQYAAEDLSALQYYTVLVSTRVGRYISIYRQLIEYRACRDLP